MTTTETSVREGALAMVHLRVNDADRAMRFFGSLLGWQGERVEFDNHISHYTVNNAVTVRLLDDPTSPPVVANYAVSEVAETIRRIEAAAFGTEVVPSETLYLAVEALEPAAAKVAELGGHAGDIAQDMGPYWTCMCTDDQGTTFGLMSLTRS